MPREVPLCHPGEILNEEYLKPMAITQYALSKALGVPPRRINEIVKGQRGITIDTALRLAAFLAPTPKAGSICKRITILKWLVKRCLKCNRGFTVTLTRQPTVEFVTVNVCFNLIFLPPQKERHA